MIPIKDYNKTQVILTSGRLIFNSTDDSVIVSTKESFIISSGQSVHINIGDENNQSESNIFRLNAGKIEFGLGKTNGDLQPVPKGDDLSKLLNNLFDKLSEIGADLAVATAIGVGVSSTPTVNQAGVKLQIAIKELKPAIDNIKSKTTFTV